jgi:hypothetical protein
MKSIVAKLNSFNDGSENKEMGMLSSNSSSHRVK